MISRIIEAEIEPIQSVWLANSSETKIIEYVDTQMKYNEDYIIIVWAYNLTIGSRYFYSNFRNGPYDSRDLGGAGFGSWFLCMQPNDTMDTEFTVPAAALYNDMMDAGWDIDEDIWGYREACPSAARSDFYNPTTGLDLLGSSLSDCDANFVATSMPTAYIKEVPFLFWAGSVIDDPPSRPDVDLKSYEGNDNELLMLLNASAGTSTEEPIIINESDQEVFDAIRASQSLSMDGIQFGNDNPVESYEIYRMTTPPHSYSDFSGNLLAEVSTIYDEDIGLKSQAVSYVDSIEPNTIYYYTFRALDLHGNFSNPTSIFNVELVSDEISVTPYVISFDAEANLKEGDESAKAVKKVLHIVPRISQSIVNEDSSNLDGSSALVVSSASPPVLGAETETIWGKTFKIRLVSKSTKRKMDFNVSFSTEYVLTPPPEEACDYLSTEVNCDDLDPTVPPPPECVDGI